MNSRTIWPTASESTLISTDQSTEGPSETMFRRAMDRRRGLTELCTTVNTKMARSTVMENTNGRTEASTREVGSKTKYQDLESTDGMTAGFTPDSGSITTCMVEAFTNGQTAGSMKETTSTTENMATESTPIPMADPTLVCGTMVSNTVKASSQIQAASVAKASGKMENDCTGWTKTIKKTTK